MDSRTDIEREAAEAVSILYLKTLQRAKSAEEAAEEARRQRDDQHRERKRTERQLDSARTHHGRIERERIKGNEERDRKNAHLQTKIARLQTEWDELSARLQSVEDFWQQRKSEWSEQEQELRNALTLAGVETRRLKTDLHNCRVSRMDIIKSLQSVMEEVQDALGS